jgi:hypothetical protein
MFKIFACFMLCSLLGSPVYASELVGQISTNPKQMQTVVATTSSPLPARPVILPIFFPLNNQLVATNSSIQIIKKTEILGNKIYTSGSLLRGQSGRVYLVLGKNKALVKNLAILRRYNGRKIVGVTDAYLAGLSDLVRKDQTLVRSKGQKKIFVLKNRTKAPIKNPNELRTKFKGQKIVEVSFDELLLY